jgi:hypothetical protein
MNSPSRRRSSGTNPNGGRRLVQLGAPAVDQNFALIGWLGAEECPDELRALGANQPGDAYDLALANLQRHVVKQAGFTQPAAFERNRAWLGLGGLAP